MNLNHNACYEAVEKRDANFDGKFFTCVKTTGIFCKPSCYARTPYSKNVVFVETIDEAITGGFRACKKCQPQELTVNTVRN
jgi:AraC family transcriptional regulator of adaptative response / DNA-3-methyladenine glycosylase II